MTELRFQAGGRFRARTLKGAGTPTVAGAAGDASNASGFEEVELTPIADVEKGAAKSATAAAAGGDGGQKAPLGVSDESGSLRRLILPDISFLVSEIAANDGRESIGEGINADTF